MGIKAQSKGKGVTKDVSFVRKDYRYLSNDVKNGKKK